MSKIYNISPIETQEKKEKFKKYSLFIADQLQKIDLSTEYGKNYISKNGLTIHDYSDLIKKISTCGNNSKYVQSDKIDNDGLVKTGFSLVETNACHVYSLCPACASAKRSSIINSIKPYIKTAEIMDNTYLYMATITIKGTKNASHDYEKLRSSWTEFTKLGQRRKNGIRSIGEASKFLGTVLSIEVVPENIVTDNYHVHGHILILASKKLEYVVYDQKKKSALHKIHGSTIPKSELDKIALKTITDLNKKNTKIAVSKISHEWHDCSGDINIHIAPIKQRVIKGKKKSVENQLYEIIKYETKPWELSPEKMIDTYTALKGKKRITKSGIFTKNKSSKKEWYDLLEYHGLVSMFNNMITPEVEDENDDYIDIINSSIEIDYNGETQKYQTTYTNNSFEHMQTAEYKKYLQDKAKIICIYKARIKIHVDLLIQIRDESDFEPLRWIATKEIIKSNMREQIKKLTLQIKSFINIYYSTKKAA